jgi:hypothetical protein
MDSVRFQWIKNIGSQIVKSVEINCGSFRIQKYSGEYISAMVEGFLGGEEGHFRQNDRKRGDKQPGERLRKRKPPILHGKRERAPSIRTNAMPINAWYTLDSKCAFPLISPVQRVVYNASPTGTHPRDVFDPDNYFPTSSPTLTWSDSRCIGSCRPAQRENPVGAYEYTTRTWNTDVHLMNTPLSFQGRKREKFAKKTRCIS